MSITLIVPESLAMPEIPTVADPLVYEANPLATDAQKLIWRGITFKQVGDTAEAEGITRQDLFPWAKVVQIRDLVAAPRGLGGLVNVKEYPAVIKFTGGVGYDQPVPDYVPHSLKPAVTDENGIIQEPARQYLWSEYKNPLQTGSHWVVGSDQYVRLDAMGRGIPEGTVLFQLHDAGFTVLSFEESPKAAQPPE